MACADTRMVLLKVLLFLPLDKCYVARVDLTHLAIYFAHADTRVVLLGVLLFLAP